MIKINKLTTLSIFFLFITTWSCSIDDEVIDKATNGNKKIAIFQQFEDRMLSSKGANLNYARPFAECVGMYFNKFPQMELFIKDNYGTIDLKVSSQTIASTSEDKRKLIFYPILKNGIVKAVAAGLVNAERDFLYFKIYQNEHPDVLYLINTFQQHYNKNTYAKGGDTHELNEVVITVRRPSQLTQYDGWSGNGGLGSIGALMYGDGSIFGNYNEGGSIALPNSGNTDPCTNVATIGKDKGTIDRMKALKGVVNENKEYGFILGKNPTTGVVDGTLVEGKDNDHDINFSITGQIDGVIHSHVKGGLSIFSVADIFGLAFFYKNGNIKNNDTFVIGVVTNSNTQYLMMIEDSLKFDAFANVLLRGNVIDKDAMKAYEHTYRYLYNIIPENGTKTNEENFVDYITKTKTGLKILKMDTEMNTYKVLSVKDDGTIKEEPCN
ncbi:hypothetical protein BWK58_05160 [Flavobacterium columnare]|nr:hypothetical protein BWK58_05160 [Flavobacterium columnare]